MPSDPTAPSRRPGDRPVLRIIRGDATREEVAALVAVLASRRPAAAAPVTATRPRSAWSDRSRLMRAPLSPAPGAWRRSALPG
jgi:hypothetical protein